jgi:hypothetical protein
MRQTRTAPLVSLLILAASPALAQTTAPAPAPGTAGSGIAAWWWLILIALVIAGVWYFMRGRNRV